jgi:hypothetical protein
MDLLAPQLDTGLKEWQTVCSALETGRQIILLRKGGISESIGGFEIEHRQFLLFPTFLHQNAAMLKEEFRAGLKSVAAEPEQITLSSTGVITNIIPMPSRHTIDGLDSEHIWTVPLIDMRFNYKPKNPLYLLLVRAYKLREPVIVQNTAEYAGCKSWVPLGRKISTENAAAILDDSQWETRRRALLELIVSR